MRTRRLYQANTPLDGPPHVHAAVCVLLWNVIATPLSHDKFKLDPLMRTRRLYHVPGEHTACKGNGPPHIHAANTDDVAGLRSTRLSVLGTNTAQSEHEGDAIRSQKPESFSRRGSDTGCRLFQNSIFSAICI